MPLQPDIAGVTFRDAFAALPEAGGERFVSVFRHGTLEVEIYAPRDFDTQQPHTRDEAYIAVHGHGEFVCGGQRIRFGPGDFLFAPAGAVHRFENFTDDLVVWVVFYGPDGGETP